MMRRAARGAGLAPVLWAVVLLAGGLGRAAVQFDVFVGYGSGGGNEGVVREACWFPIGCEVFNEGDSFKATIEFSTAPGGRGHVVETPIELPAQTRKRFSIPVFAGVGAYPVWHARLLDESGKVRAERRGIRPRGIERRIPLLGALARSHAGLPRFPPLQGSRRPEQIPRVARLGVDQFPDNPLALEGLDALYLNSEKALELNPRQARALTRWVAEGGRLIVAVEQAQDLTGLPWLGKLVPVVYGSVLTQRNRGELERWVRSPSPEARAVRAFGLREPSFGKPASSFRNIRIPSDPEFAQAVLPRFAGKVKRGEALAGPLSAPWIVEADYGRGRVTALLFNPEREPYLSWKGRPWMWVKLIGAPPELWVRRPAMAAQEGSLDAVFAEMIETRQIKKLPIGLLIGLLAAYLLVIGPFDWWSVRRLRREWLTWITFPLYVAIFSALVYFIGYKVRAGVTEANELHLVDVVRTPEETLRRGRTYAAIYSPANADYRLAAPFRGAAFRPEMMGRWVGPLSRQGIRQRRAGEKCEAEVFVPVWSSRTFVCEWAESGSSGLEAQAALEGGRLRVKLVNRSRRAWDALFVCYGNNYRRFENLRPGAAAECELAPEGGGLDGFLARESALLRGAMIRRGRAYRGSGARLDPRGEHALGASLYLRTLAALRSGAGVAALFPPGCDLSGFLEAGKAVVLGWRSGAPEGVGPLTQFQTRRRRTYTVARWVLSPSRPGEQDGS